MGTPRKYTSDLLGALVAESHSIAEVMRKLGFRRAGKGQRRFRLTPDAILVRRSPDSPRAKPHLLRRALRESGVPYACVRCGNPGMWMSETLTLEVDHIDGDLHNNLRENLRFLCPNCHRLTPNFAGRSWGKFSEALHAGDINECTAT